MQIVGGNTIRNGSEEEEEEEDRVLFDAFLISLSLSNEGEIKI